MATSLEEAATMLQMEKEKLTEASLKAFLRERLRELRAEATAIYLKYGVSSLEELDEQINRGALNESDTFDDFSRLDYLEGEKDKLGTIMQKLQHQTFKKSLTKNTTYASQQTLGKVGSSNF